MFRKKSKSNPRQVNPVLSVYTSLFSVILCMICLAGSSWAWFTSTRTSAVDPIKSAELYINDLSVTHLITDGRGAQVDEEAAEIRTTQNGFEFDAAANTLYVVDVSLGGTATSGFLYVQTCDGVFFSPNISTEFALVLTQDCKVQLSASWGTHTEGMIKFDNKAQIGGGVVPTCTCELQCPEDGIQQIGEDEEPCQVCVRDHNYCTGRPVCSCETLCLEEANEECPVCAENKEACEGEPVCTCETKCTELNEACPVCAESTETCKGTESEETEPEETEPDETEPDETETEETEPKETETEETEPKETETEETEPKETETEETEPKETETEETEPKETETEETEPKETETEETEPKETETEEAEPNETQPKETDPPATEPAPTQTDSPDESDPTDPTGNETV